MQALCAQQDTLIPEIPIRASRLSVFSRGLSTQVYDSVLIQRSQHLSVAQFLARESGEYVKTYGVSGVATANVRGLGAAHFAVLWNGINLNSPMLGLCDLSLLPVAFAGQMTFQRGGGGAVFGQSAIGGVLRIDADPEFFRGREFAVGIGMGSFGLLRADFKAGLHRLRSSTQVQAFYQQVQNDFPYQNFAYANAQKSFLRNAATRAQGLMVNQVFRFSPRWGGGVALWQQTAQREFPPNMTQQSSQAEQSDESWRFMAHLNYTAQRHSLGWKAAWLQEKLRYKDAGFALDELSRARQLQQELDWKFAVGEGVLLNSGVQWIFEQAQTPAYGEGVFQRHRYAGFAAAKWTLNRVELLGGVRVEYYGQKHMPVLPHATLIWHMRPGMEIALTSASTYRMPTLNDLFWSDATARGNRLLRPESGWNFNLDNRQMLRRGNWLFQRQTALYAILLQDAIVWTPDDAGVWMPRNQDQLKVFGLEAEASAAYQWRSLKWGFSGGVGLNRSISPNGLQAIYTPLWRGRLAADISHENWHLRVGHTFTGKRFTASDQSASLPAFTLGWLSAGHRWSFKRYALQVSLQVDNIWDTAYQNMPWRPMPGRNFQLSFQFTFK